MIIYVWYHYYNGPLVPWQIISIDNVTCCLWSEYHTTSIRHIHIYIYICTQTYVYSIHSQTPFTETKYCCNTGGMPLGSIYTNVSIVLAHVFIWNDYASIAWNATLNEQGKSEGFDSCDQVCNLEWDPNWFFWSVWPWNLTSRNNREPLSCSI